MKKIIAFLLCFVFLLTACGRGQHKSENFKVYGHLLFDENGDVYVRGRAAALLKEGADDVTITFFLQLPEEDRFELGSIHFENMDYGEIKKIDLKVNQAIEDHKVKEKESVSLGKMLVTYEVK
ncbi:MAG: hypothetical protein PT957_01830 [Firmicutes bacterium]|nr:hypothetical protein [Bacillota bacterium]